MSYFAGKCNHVFYRFSAAARAGRFASAQGAPARFYAPVLNGGPEQLRFHCVAKNVDSPVVFCYPRCIR
jgi:hypothetical protein